MAQLYAFGDSITYGSWDREGSGWANRLRQALDEEHESGKREFTLFYNLGIPGETTEHFVQRFVPETEARFRSGERYTFTFAFGANDACFIPSKNQFKVTVEQYKQNFETILEQAKPLAERIIILNITPVVDELTVAPTGKDKSRLNKYITPYNEVLKDLAADYSLELIDVNAAFMAEENLADLFCEDGLHPNANGHKLIFEVMKDLFS